MQIFQITDVAAMPTFTRKLNKNTHVTPVIAIQTLRENKCVYYAIVCLYCKTTKHANPHQAIKKKPYSYLAHFALCTKGSSSLSPQILNFIYRAPYKIKLCLGALTELSGTTNVSWILQICLSKASEILTGQSSQQVLLKSIYVNLHFNPKKCFE